MNMDPYQKIKDLAESCTAHGSGLYDARAGVEASFTCYFGDVASDAGGDAITADAFKATLVSDDLHFDLVVKDRDESSCTFSYDVRKMGTYQLRVTMMG